MTDTDDEETGFYKMSNHLHTIIPVVTGPLGERVFHITKDLLSLEMMLSDISPRHGKMHSENVEFRNGEDKVTFQQDVHIVFVDSVTKIPDVVAESCKILKIAANEHVGVTLFKIYGKTRKINDHKLLEIRRRIHELLPGAGVGIL
jgi:hypothetical protein